MTHPPHDIDSPAFIRDVFQWDVASWRFALEVWAEAPGDLAGAEVLDLGARDGGLSLYFASRGCRVVCSDYSGPSDKAVGLHRCYGVQDRVSYRRMDATAIDSPDACFDIVCFKSVLGAVGAGGRPDRQQRALMEVHRVLRPGGRLLFAENLQASWLHRVLRRRCVAWGQRWRYPSLRELEAMLSHFRQTRIRTSGCLAVLGRTEKQRQLLHAVDVLLRPVIPSRWHYVAAGYALK